MIYLIVLISLFLFTSSSLHSMDTLSDDLIVYDIGVRLNRVTKNNFRLSCKRNAQLILSQTTLNRNYTKACTSHDEKKATEWRRQGGLHYHEEVYNLFIEDKESLSFLLLKQKHDFTQYCVFSVFSYGIRRNNKAFIQWLLVQNISISKSDYISKSIDLAKAIGNREITQLLETYIKPYPYWGKDCLGYCVE